MAILRTAVSLLPIVALNACLSGSANYMPPAPAAPITKSLDVQRPRADVWKAMIPKAAQLVFVINTMDQSSGLLNLSYSGDPERFIDCGTISSTVSNLRGTRDYRFPGSRAFAQYEIKAGSSLVGITRNLSLDGRANIVLQELSPSSTRVTVNVRYVVQKSLAARDATGHSSAASETLSFSSGEAAAFPSGQSTCRSTGELEKELLALAAP